MPACTARSRPLAKQSSGEAGELPSGRGCAMWSENSRNEKRAPWTRSIPSTYRGMRYSSRACSGTGPFPRKDGPLERKPGQTTICPGRGWLSYLSGSLFNDELAEHAAVDMSGKRAVVLELAGFGDGEGDAYFKAFFTFRGQHVAVHVELVDHEIVLHRVRRCVDQDDPHDVADLDDQVRVDDAFKIAVEADDERESV